MSIETAYQILFSFALIWLSVLILAMLIRSIHGPRITDRILSINMIGTLASAVLRSFRACSMKATWLMWP